MQAIRNISTNDLIARYQAGETIAQLAEAIRCAGSTIVRRFCKAGFKGRRTGPSRTYTLYEGYFEEINTEEKAYWLGFLFADGAVQQTTVGNWTLRLELQESDVGHIRKFRQAIGSNAPIVYASHRKNGKESKSAYLLLCSARLCRSLIKLGCIPRKTGVHGTPDIDINLYRHFYRGAVDGDGSIFAIPQIHAWRFELTAAPRFAKDFQEWLVPCANINKTKLIRPKQSEKVRVVRYTGGPQIERICGLLYDNATIYLERKMDSVQQLFCRPKRQAA